MLNKLSIRLKLTLLSTLLLTITCVGLTFALNISAFKFIDSVEQAQALTPFYPQNSFPAIDLTTPSQATINARSGFRYESIFLMLGFILTGSALTYYVTGKVFKPLETLTQEVQNITIDNLQSSVSIPSTEDEIAKLSQSFNQMAGSLNESFETQKRFSVNAAHELRTPLTVLQTKLDVFKKNPEHSKEDYDALLETFNKQTTRLRNLIQDLLSMTQVDTQYEMHDIDLLVLMEDILEELGLTTRISLVGDSRNIQGNYDLLFRAFSNLIENAIQYTKLNTPIEIEIASNYVSIKDDGDGIPSVEIPYLFEPFYRMDTAPLLNQGGAGLGLSIVKAILQKHHATIELTSCESFKTCFKINI